jgi:hypothetical protein
MRQPFVFGAQRRENPGQVLFDLFLRADFVSPFDTAAK